MFWVMTALAGNVYLNGVHVEPSQLAGLELKKVDVRLDTQGNVYIDAPGYNVRPAEGSTAPTAPAPMPAGPIVPSSAPVAPRWAPSPDTTVPPGRWWLYVDDQGSSGHQVTVSVNGTVVKQLRSGDQVILDVGRWLVPGANKVRIDSISTAPSGGPLYVYVGQGRDANGTVDLGTPEIQYGIGRSREGAAQREFELQVSP